MPTLRTGVFTSEMFGSYVRGQAVDVDSVSGRELDQLAEQTFNISRQRHPGFQIGMDGNVRTAERTYESDSSLRRRIMNVISNPASYPQTFVDKPLTAMIEAKLEPKRMSRWQRLLEPIL